MKTKDRCKNQPLLTRSVSKEGDRATTASPKVRLMLLHLGVLIKKTTIYCVFLLDTSIALWYVCGVALGSGAQPVKPSDPDVHRDHDSPQSRDLLLLLLPEEAHHG